MKRNIQVSIMYVLLSIIVMITSGCGGDKGACCGDSGPISFERSYDATEDVLSHFSLPDKDAGGNTLSYVLLGDVSHGQILGDSPDFTYEPNANFSGKETVKFTIKRSGREVGVITVIFNVKALNDAPQGNSYVTTTNEAAAIDVNVLNNDFDLDGDTLSITNLTQPSHGTTVISGTKVTYTPTVGFFGVDTFTYTPYDGKEAGNITTVTVNVSSTNNRPIGRDDNVTIPEDTITPTTINILANDTDGDGDTLSITNLSTPAHGTATLNGQIISYIPNLNFKGVDTLTYTPNDGTNDGNTVTVSFIVTNTNDVPLSANDAVTIAEDTPTLINVLSNDADADFDPLSISILTAPIFGDAIVEGNNVRYIPNPNVTGTDTFTYAPNDGTVDGAPATVTITITPSNDRPTGSNDEYTTFEDTQKSLAVLSNDADVDGDTLAITNITLPSNGTVTLTGSTLSYTPNANYNGTDTFTYTPNDGTIDGDVVTVIVNVVPVSDVPVGVNDSITVDEDASVVINPLSNDLDADNDTLTLVGVTNPANGIINLSGNTITYTPNANYFGADSFTYIPDDGDGNDTQGNVTTVLINVTSVNDKPISLDDNATTDEDTPVDISVLVNDTDVEGNTLSIVNLINPAHGTVSIINGTTVHYIPDANFNGEDSFTYTANDGTDNGLPANVTVFVAPIVDIPVGVDDTVTLNEDSNIDISVLGNDTDGDGDTLSVTTLTEPSHGSATTNGTIITYTPVSNYHGNDTLTYIPYDGTSGGNVVTVNITVTSVGDFPVGIDDTGSTAEDTPITLNLITNDTDVDNDPLTIINLSNPSNGTVTQDGTSITYTPNLNYNGTDTFTYTPTDGNLVGNETTVTITISIVSDAPVGVDDNVDMLEDTTTVIDVLGNDTDGDGQTLSITNLTQPAHGVSSIGSGGVNYIPNANFSGIDTFTYTPNDGDGDGNIVTVRINVNNIPDIPIAHDDINTTLENTAIVLQLLENDTDADNDNLTIALTSFPQHGTALISLDGQTVTYTPFTQFSGEDSFTYKANDGQNDSAQATVKITVQACMTKTWEVAPSGNFNGVIPDGQGNIYAVGSITLGSDLAGQLVKFDSNGAQVWRKLITTSTHIELFDVKVGTDGTIYAVGLTGTNGGDGLVIAYDSAGTQLWTSTFGGTSADDFSHLALDNTNNIYAVGSTSSNDGDITAGNNGGQDALIVKFDTTGAISWNKTYGGGNDEQFNSIAIDSANNLYAVGEQEVSNNNTDGLIVKFDNTGSIQWDKTEAGSLIDDAFHGVAVDSNNNVFAAGYQRSNVGWVRSYTESGASRDEYVLTNASAISTYADITIDNEDGLYAVGEFNSQALLSRFDNNLNNICERRTVKSFSATTFDSTDGSVYTVGAGIMAKWKPLLAQ